MHGPALLSVGLGLETLRNVQIHQSSAAELTLASASWTPTISSYRVFPSPLLFICLCLSPCLSLCVCVCLSVCLCVV